MKTITAKIEDNKVIVTKDGVVWAEFPYMTTAEGNQFTFSAYELDHLIALANSELAGNTYTGTMMGGNYTYSDFKVFRDDTFKALTVTTDAVEHKTAGDVIYDDTTLLKLKILDVDGNYVLSVSKRYIEHVVNLVNDFTKVD